MKDGRNNIKEFIYGKTYSISFYGASGDMRFVHTRKSSVILQNTLSNGKVDKKVKISKRELKQLLREEFVQWVVEL